MSDLTAGHELDAMVAEKVMGWTAVEAKYTGASSQWFVPSGVNPFSRPNPNMRQQVPAYSTDIAAAWLVVDKMLADGWELDTGIEKKARLEDGQWVVEFNSSTHNAEHSRGPRAIAHTAPLAICKASLAAVAHGTGTP